MKCGKHFDALQEIDGKERHLYCRNYCLECSPFKGKNKSTLHELDCNDEQISYLKGIIDSDGTLSYRGQSYRFSLMVIDEDFAEHTKDILDEVLESDVKVTQTVELDSGNKRYDVQKGSKALYKELNSISVEDAQPRPYLNAFFTGDGTIYSIENNVRIETQVTDREIIEAVRKKLEEIGIEANTRISTNDHDGWPDKLYRLSFSSKQEIKKFYEESGFSTRRKQRVLEEGIE